MSRPPASRSSSAHSNRSNGKRQPTRIDDERQLDFCNAFWNPGGVENLLDRMKSGGKVLTELTKWLDERASIEEDYAKRLMKLSKSSLGTLELGTLRGAFEHISAELAHYAHSHMELAKLMRTQLEGGVKGFYARREDVKKGPQQGIEKSYKLKKQQEELASKARKKFEDDCITINGLTAQTSLIQGRDLDKVGARLDKVNQTVMVNEKEYATHINALKESTFKWNIDWKSFCDLCQDLEEERIDYIKVVFWDYANAISTVCVAVDESCERVRVALEGCDTARDIRGFVRQHGTGNEINDPPPYVNFAKNETVPTKPSFSLANFARSSTHTKVQTSLTAVQDLVNAIRSRPATPAPPPPEQPAQGPTRPSSPQVTPSKPAQPYPINTAPVPVQPPIVGRIDMFDELKTPVAAPEERGRSEVVSRVGTIATKATVGPGTPSKASTPMEAIQAAVHRGTTQPKIAAMTTPPTINVQNQNHRSQESVTSIVSNSSNRAGSPTPSVVSVTSGIGRTGSKRYTVQRASAGDVKQVVNATTPPKIAEQPTVDPLEQALQKLKDESYESSTPKPPPGAVPLPGMTTQQSYRGANRKPNGIPEPTASPTKQATIVPSYQQPPSYPQQPPYQPNPVQNQHQNGHRAPSPSRYQTQPPPPRIASPLGISLDANGQIIQETYGISSQQHQLPPQPQQQQIQVQQPPQPQYPFRPQSQAAYTPPHMQNYGQQYQNGMTQMPTNGYVPSTMYNQSQYSQTPQPQQAYAPPYQQQQVGYQQQQYPQPAQVRAPSRAPNYTDDGRPILFYVTAQYDFAGEQPTDLHFTTGDILAVVKTLEDGWWEGMKVGVEGTGMFPSNFVKPFE